MPDVPDDALRETWQSVYAKTLKLAEMIEAHCRETGERFDAIVVIPRGSYYLANVLARRFGFDATELLQLALTSYKQGKAERVDDFMLGQTPTDNEVRGKKLLIVDEVCDTGETLRFVADRLKGQGADLVRAGVLHYKPAQSTTGFKPDWAALTTDRWVVYPWEEQELTGSPSVVKV